MAAQARLFTYAGISQAFVANFSQQKSDNSIALLKQPYLARANITVDTGTPQASTADLSPEHTRILHVQVAPGQRVHIEINPPGRTNGPVTADTSSPIVEGDEQFEFGRGWLVSLLEAA